MVLSFEHIFLLQALKEQVKVTRTEAKKPVPSRPYCFLVYIKRLIIRNLFIFNGSHFPPSTLDMKLTSICISLGTQSPAGKKPKDETHPFQSVFSQT